METEFLQSPQSLQSGGWRNSSPLSSLLSLMAFAPKYSNYVGNLLGSTKYLGFQKLWLKVTLNDVCPLHNVLRTVFNRVRVEGDIKE